MLYLTSDQFPVCASLSILYYPFHVLTFALSSRWGIQSYHSGSLGELHFPSFLISLFYNSPIIAWSIPLIWRYDASLSHPCRLREKAHTTSSTLSYHSLVVGYVYGRPPCEMDGRTDLFRHTEPDDDRSPMGGISSPLVYIRGVTTPLNSHNGRRWTPTESGWRL